MVFKVGCVHTLAIGLEYLHNGMAWSVSGHKKLQRASANVSEIIRSTCKDDDSN